MTTGQTIALTVVGLTVAGLAAWAITSAMKPKGPPQLPPDLEDPRTPTPSGTDIMGDQFGWLDDIFGSPCKRACDVKHIFNQDARQECKWECA